MLVIVAQQWLLEKYKGVSRAERSTSRLSLEKRI